MPPAVRADMRRRWSPGDVVVLRYMGLLRGGTPAIMVEDSDERVLAYVPHGVRWYGSGAAPAGRSERVRAIARGERRDGARRW